VGFINSKIYIQCIYNALIMVKVITIGEDAYGRLKKLKRQGDSFTDVIMRLTTGRGDLTRHAGKWKDMTDKEERELFEVLRVAWDKWQIESP